MFTNEGATVSPYCLGQEASWKLRQVAMRFLYLYLKRRKKLKMYLNNKLLQNMQLGSCTLIQHAKEFCGNFQFSIQGECLEIFDKK